MMNIRLTGLVLGLLAVLLAGCASSPTAVTDHDPSFNFGAVRNIHILPLDRQVSSVAAVSDIQAARMNEDISRVLTERGYSVVDSAQQADLLLSWHLVTQERTDVRTYNSMSARYTSCWSCPSSHSTNVSVRQFTQGTLIVDMIDPQGSRSVWRSIVEERLRDLSAEQAAEMRREVALAVFADFPP